jgi:alpha-tubulin suppressor-like RCC1 family protein
MIARLAPVVAALAAAGCEILFPLDSGPPADAAPPGRWQSVYPGVHTTYAIDTAGALWAWGENSTGAVGDGTRLERTTPVMIDAGPWTKVAPGHLFACAIRPDRTAACWGNNNHGQLGIDMPAVTDALAPTDLPGTWDEIAGGAEHACGVDAGTLWCWGRDSDGQAGQSGVDLHAPTRLGGDTNWDGIAAGSYHTCGHRLDGTLWCWGDNDYGQLGQGIPSPGTNVPALVPGPGPWGPPVTRHVHTCALQIGDESAWCWGLNAYGEIGDGTNGFAPAPTLVAGETGWTALAVGIHHTCGLRGGAPFCWGVGHYGSLALGDDTGAPRDTPAAVPAPVPFASIAAGGFYSCGLTADHRLWCAGLDASGQLGGGAGGDRHAPVALGGGPWNAVDTGASHSCARSAAGELACWGYNAAGQLGDDSVIPRQRPGPVPTAGGGTPAGGIRHTSEIRPDQSLWCWGHNAFGQLGQGDLTDRWTPIQVQPGTTWTAVATANHTCAIKTDASLWCWGRNADYTLGDGMTTDRAVPYRVVTTAQPDAWLAVAVGPTHTCAIRSDQRLWCWGRNAQGQVGTGNLMAVAAPAIGMNAEVDQVAAGLYHTCARRTSGRTLACWGDNGSGQLGDGTRTRRLQATDIAPGQQWAAITAGGSSSCAIGDATGTLHCWGMNSSGQVGDGTVDDRLTPTPVRPDLAWIEVAPAGAHTCGLATGGDLRCWGDAGVGGLGDGTAWRSSLVEVP